MNWSALSDEELLVFVEDGSAEACRAAADRLREIVDAGCYATDEIDNAYDEGESALACTLLRQFDELLSKLSDDDDSPLGQEKRNKVRDLYNLIQGAA